jgi:Leucine-rich repeat (LRR) protein
MPPLEQMVPNTDDANDWKVPTHWTPSTIARVVTMVCPQPTWSSVIKPMIRLGSIAPQPGRMPASNRDEPPSLWERCGRTVTSAVWMSADCPAELDDLCLPEDIQSPAADNDISALDLFAMLDPNPFVDHSSDPPQRLAKHVSSFAAMFRFLPAGASATWFGRLLHTSLALSSMSTLILSNAELNEWPMVVFGLPNLSVLDLSHNSLISWPIDSLRTLAPRLTVLRLSYNQLTELPSVLFPSTTATQIQLWPKLALLAVDHNRITELPYGIGWCLQLSVSVNHDLWCLLLNTVQNESICFCFLFSTGVAR